MSTISVDILTPEQLAKQLEQDIIRRALAPQQKYLSTRQVGERFGVSISLAAQAMQLLADQEKLVRATAVEPMLDPPRNLAGHTRSKWSTY